MRFRLFVVFLLLFLAALVGGNLFYQHSLRKERLLLLDSQIESRTDQILKSGVLSRAATEEDESYTNELLSEILGGAKIGFFMVLKDQDGAVLYRNDLGDFLEINFSPDSKWSTVSLGESRVRVYHQKLPEVNLMLDTGYVFYETNRSFFDAKISYPFLAISFLVSFFLSYFLSLWVFRPFQRLNQIMSDVAENFHPDRVELLEEEKIFKKNKSVFGSDESIKVFSHLKKILQRSSAWMKENKMHSARLAHEILTPLSILRNLSTEKNQETKMKEQIDRLSSFVQRYITWAELSTKDSKRREIYALSAKELISKVLDEMIPLAPGRIVFENECNQDAKIFCHPDDGEHLLQNLLSNSIKYSQGKIWVRLKAEGILVIEDEGKGFAPETLLELGKPFNRGGAEKGSYGLGLSIVLSICELYGWKYEVKNTESGSISIITYS